MSKKLNFPMKKVKEGSAEIFIPTEKKISKKLPVFYNPIMKFNRDITILLLKQFKPMNICDALAGTGIRAIRFAKELKYKSIVANDISERAAALIKKNMKLNKVKFEVKNEDANILLLKSKGFDYIDLDVFGFPGPFLDSAVKRLARNGILAVTATDTSALSGTYPTACKRKYWAQPLRNEIMHEFGLRILIRKIQLIAAQYDKALTPIFSYYKDHYMRTFLSCNKGKTKVDNILKQHTPYNNAGPIWTGQLWNTKLVSDMLKLAKEKNIIKFLAIIKEESGIQVVGFYDTHKLQKKIIKKSDLIKKIKKIGYKASETHFTGTGIRSNILKKKELNKL